MSSHQYVYYHSPLLPRPNVRVANRAIHRHPRKHQSLCGLLSLILPNRTARCINPNSTSPILIDSDGVTINILPDDVLLDIFLVDGLQYQHRSPEAGFLGAEEDERVRRLPWKWHRLAHVCSRWRSIVFASPNFLNLRLFCGPRTRMEELTDIWPPLPIIITNAFDTRMPEDYDFDAAIVHPDRVREISLFGLTRSLSQGLAEATRMQEPFPALTHLLLSHPFDGSGIAPALPDGFLNGSAPRLQSLALNSISFPALPTLLLSATHLVRLTLHWIPHSGYFSPEAIVTALAVMASLEFLTIKFESPLSRPHNESRRPPPPTRTVLPALARLVFKGASEYLGDFVARIDAPLLDSIYITFFLQLVFNIPRLAQFMGRTKRFQILKEAHVYCDFYGGHVETLPPTQPIHKRSVLKILCGELDRQLSSLAHVFSSFFPSIHLVEHLYIYKLHHLPVE